VSPADALALAEQVEALAAKATPGPWSREMTEDGEMLPDGTGTFDGYVETNDVEAPPIGDDGYHNPIANCFHGHDAAFIAAARTLVEDLGAALRESVAREAAAEHERDAALVSAEVLRGERDHAREELEHLRATIAAALGHVDELRRALSD
jgi:hypothetical protein